MDNKYPFKFLDSYEQEDTEKFFGREDEITELYRMIFQTNILMVYGASGTGKTSLIQCGLAGKFEAHDWFAIYVRRGSDLNGSLNKAIIAAGGKAGTADLAKSIEEIYLKKFRPIYFIFDQFEELYTYTAKNEQSEKENIDEKEIASEDPAKKEEKIFVETIKQLLGLEQQVKIIFSVREDYIGHLYDFEKAVPLLMRKKLRIEPMTLKQVRDVILGTIRKSDFISIKKEKEDKGDIAAAIFEKIRGKDKALTIQLPYLQVFLYKLYNATKNDEGVAEFSLEAVKNMAEIGDILKQFLEEQVKAISDQLSKDGTVVTEGNIWSVLSPLATKSGTKKPIKKADLLDDIAKADESKLIPVDKVKIALKGFVDARILRETEGVYELSHDSLAAKVHERRSKAAIELIEVNDLIATQLKQTDADERLFSAKQLERIDDIKDKLNLQGEAKTLYDDSWKKVKRKKITTIAVVAGIITTLTILCVFMFALYQDSIVATKDANDAKAIAEKANIAADLEKKNAINTLNKLLRQTAMNKAKEDESYGDSYKDNDNKQYALESYNEAIATLNIFKDTVGNKDLTHMLNRPVDSFINALKVKLKGL
ncbi:MAG: ATP-binding protein [Flavipsychrobacter sp.]|nr:ATP-binding protein [Flavipsychrobacter sp.]